MPKPTTKSKEKYNAAAYARFTIRIRKDSALYLSVQDFMEKDGASFNFLVEKLLTEHFLREDE